MRRWLPWIALSPLLLVGVGVVRADPPPDRTVRAASRSSNPVSSSAATESSPFSSRSRSVNNWSRNDGMAEDGGRRAEERSEDGRWGAEESWDSAGRRTEIDNTGAIKSCSSSLWSCPSKCPNSCITTVNKSTPPVTNDE